MENKIESDNTQSRVDAFLSEYSELVKKHDIDFINYPMFQPDGQGNWKIVINTQPVDTRSQPRKSPFVV